MNISEMERSSLLEEDTVIIASGNGTFIAPSSTDNSDVSNSIRVKFQIFWYILMGIITLTTIIANSFVLYLFFKGKNRLRSPTHILLANLAVADLLVGLIVMPPLASVTVSPTYYWIWGPFACKVSDYVHFCLCALSMTSMIGVAVERYVGVTYPLHYKRMITRKRVYAMIFIIWITAVIITSVPLTLWPDHQKKPNFCNTNLRKAFLFYVTVVLYCIPVAVSLTFYYLLYRNAIKPFIEPKQFHDDIASSTFSNSVVSNAPKSAWTSKVVSKSELETITSARNKQIFLAKKLSFLMGILLIMFAPLFGVFLLKGLESHYFSLEILFLVAWLRYTNSCVNPFIYALSVPGYKAEFFKFFLNEDKKDKDDNDYTGSSSDCNYEGDIDNQQEVMINVSLVPSGNNKLHAQKDQSTGQNASTNLSKFCTYCGKSITDEGNGGEVQGNQSCFCSTCFKKFASGRVTFVDTQNKTPAARPQDLPLTKTPSTTMQQFVDTQNKTPAARPQDLPLTKTPSTTMQQLPSPFQKTPTPTNLSPSPTVPDSLVDEIQSFLRAIAEKKSGEDNASFVKHRGSQLLTNVLVIPPGVGVDQIERKLQAGRINELRKSVMIPMIERRSVMLNSSGNPNDIDWGSIKELDDIIAQLETSVFKPLQFIGEDA